MVLMTPVKTPTTIKSKNSQTVRSIENSDSKGYCFLS
jgi:hypothetical protein